jgi:hypothetical protein
VTLAKQVLRSYSPASEPFPDYHLVKAKQRALEKYGDALAGIEDLL